MRQWLRSPLFWVLLTAAGLRLAGLFWGLPSADGWDDDGFAPRNFLTALALTWKPGAYFTYPPLQALLLALPALPVAGWALAHASSLSQHDVIAAITQPAIMTYFAVLGRLVSLAMSLGIIWSVGEMTRRVAGSCAGLLAAIACALNFGLTYYGQVSNLDVPYLFWACLALLWCMRAVMDHQPRLFWPAALFAAAAVATKDQAYALFLLSLPLFLLFWFAADRWPRAQGRQIALVLLPAAAVSLFLLLLVDGAITNPSGFLHRVAFLAGSASQDYAEYVHGPSGWLALLGDMGGYYAQGYGLAAVILAVLGMGLHILRSRDVARIVGLLPLLTIISFTVCFNFAALRSDDRFLLPQAVLSCVYIGIAAEALAFPARAWTRFAGRGALLLVALAALHQAVAISAAMLFDPRYDAERWMAAHVKPGDVVETYGQNCFLPRFPQGSHVIRVGQGSLKVRNPLPGVTELRQPFIAPRNPRFVVLSLAWAIRYLRPATPLPAGHIYSHLQQLDFANTDARLYFQALVNGAAGYRLAYAARPPSLWPIVHIHDSLDEPVWIFERAP
jgi:4-amino-4-deoxy-L-arabinose transferase-like glycosyltransferase